MGGRDIGWIWHMNMPSKSSHYNYNFKFKLRHISQNLFTAQIIFFLFVHRRELIERQIDRRSLHKPLFSLCMVYAPFKWCVCVNGCIRHLPTIIAAMLNENDEMYWVGDQRTTIYNHSQSADLTTHNKHTILYREPLPSCFYCPSLQLLDRVDGKAFS